MSFFKTLLPIISGLDRLSMQISVSDAEKGILTISLLPRTQDVKDEAIQKIKPMVLRGTVEELDAEFLTVIAQPIQKAAGLFANLSEFEASVDKAKEASKLADEEKKAKKDQAEKDKKQTMANDAKADGLLIEADELLKEKKGADALKKLTRFLESTTLLSEKRKTALNEKVEEAKAAQVQSPLFA